MNKLDLNVLNIHSPYSVWEVGKQAYGFKTEYDVLYRIVFIDDQTIWEKGAYEFAILNENQKSSPNDKSNFAAVIVQKDNPALSKILSDFDDFVGFFTDKPQ